MQSPECTVLVVDDDESCRDALTCWLESEGFKVSSYSNPAEVLAVAELPPYCCVVTDYRMLEMDGLEFVAALRKRRSAIPAILVTGDPSPTVRKRASAAYVPVIEKLCLDELPGCIREMIGQWSRASN